MLLKLFALCLLFSLGSAEDIPTLSVPDLIRYWGYDFENHFVVTDDDYVLGVHRIKTSSGGEKSSKIPVFLQHGLFGSSARFTAGPPEKSLAYILSDLGHDVWLGNTRGNTYSKNRTTIDPENDPNFWNFDWDVAAQHDLPAVIEYIRKETNSDKIIYVGHSMGSTELLVLLSEQPKFNEVIEAAFLLAPVAYMGHTKGSMATLAPHVGILESTLGAVELFPDMKWTSWLGHEICADSQDSAIYGPLCRSIAQRFIDVSPNQLNFSMLPVYMDNWPEGGSSLPVYHYAQLIRDKEYFRKYDFGDKNPDHYDGNHTPPEYDLSKITAPLHLFYGDNDKFVAEEDFLRLVKELPNVKTAHKVPFEGWQHNDFVYGVDAPEFVYEIIKNNLPQ